VLMQPLRATLSLGMLPITENLIGDTVSRGILWHNDDSEVGFSLATFKTSFSILRCPCNWGGW